MNRVICPRCWSRKDPHCDKCGNRGSIFDTKLTKNFVLSEFTYSPTAQRLYLPNDATVKQVERIQGLCKNLLQPLRDDLGAIRVTSGVRSTELNAAIPGSAVDSAHLYAYAGDIQPEHALLQDVMHWFHANQKKRPFDQVILEYGRREKEYDDDWVHVGWKHRSGAQRGQMLVQRDGKFTQWVG